MTVDGERRTARLGSLGARVQGLVVPLVAAAAMFVAAASVNRDITGLYHDDGIYLATSRSLASTGAYRLINVPGSPLQTKYPPVYPLLLAGIWGIAPSFPQNLWLLKLVNVLMLGGIVLLTDRWVSTFPRMPRLLRVLTALVVATAPGLMWMADLLMSEPTFVVLTFAVIVVAATDHESSTARLVSVGLLAGLAALTRTVGMAVCVGLVWHVWCHQGWRRAIWVAAAGLALILPWQVTACLTVPSGNALVRYYTSYEPSAWSHLLAEPALAWPIIATNALLLTRALPMALGLAGLPVAIAGLVVMGIGAFEPEARSRLGLAARLLVFYVLIIVAHPYPMARYLVPMAPFGYVLLTLGSKRLAGWSRTPAVAVLPLAVVLVTNALWFSHYRAATATGIHGEFGRQLPFKWAGFEETFEWLDRNTPRSAVVASAYDTLYFNYSGRQSVRPWVHDPERYAIGYGLTAPLPDGMRLSQDLSALGVRYLVVDPLLNGRESDYGRASVNAILAADRSGWKAVFRTADGAHVVYQHTD